MEAIGAEVTRTEAAATNTRVDKPCLPTINSKSEKRVQRSLLPCDGGRLSVECEGVEEPQMCVNRGSDAQH